MSAGPLVVTYPLTARRRAIVQEELSGAPEAILSRGLGALPFKHRDADREPGPVRCRFTANGNAIRGRHKHAAHPVRSSDRVEGCGAACFGMGSITHVRTGDTKR